MNRNTWFMLASVGGIICGIVLKGVSKVLALILILLGILCAFVLLFSTALKNANRCPGCGFMLYPGVRMLKDKKDGLIRCPRCEILVRIEDMKVQSGKH